MLKSARIVLVSFICLITSATFSCDSIRDGIKDLSKLDPHKEPIVGMTEFISADIIKTSTKDQPREGVTTSFSDPTDLEFHTQERAPVGRGDIYRIFPNHIIANLNSYRGLQLIDISDLEAPAFIGSVRIRATPVDMHVLKNVAYLLMNDWQGYSGNHVDLTVEKYNGGVVLAIDISDPAAPELVSRANVPGSIVANRIVATGNNAALYIASDNPTNNGKEMIVRSFTLGDDGGITTQSTLNLGEYVQDIQTTPEAMLVAWDDRRSDSARNLLAIIDISTPDGIMVQGVDIPIAGRIYNKSNMDLYNGILRVVSGSQWQDNVNHLQTFDVTDINNPIAIDHDRFGENDELEDALFLNNKAFFVTKFRQAPFHAVEPQDSTHVVDLQTPIHAFEIDDKGNAAEKTEYAISDWNVFFRAVSSQTRLIGIGIDEKNGFNMVVNLYDINDLLDPNPLVAHAELNIEEIRSEATWDERTFSVLENAVSVYKNDVEETGLILLPFEAYTPNWEEISGVQLFTFSDHTVTKRGIMGQNNHINRSFLAQPDAIANISGGQLCLVDPTNPDAPVDLGRLDLAPYYSNFMIFGEYGLRRKKSITNPRGETDILEIITLDRHPETAPSVATIEIPSTAMIYQVGDLLVTLETIWQEETYLSHIQVYDLSNPQTPRMAGNLKTDKLQPYGGYRYPYETNDMDTMTLDFESPFSAPRAIYYPNPTFSMQNSLVLTGLRYERDVVEKETHCRTLSSYDIRARLMTSEEQLLFNQYTIKTTDPVSQDGTSLNPPPADNEWYEGVIMCDNREGETPECNGEILFCSADENSRGTCEAVDPATIKTTTLCLEENFYTGWHALTMYVLDLTDPDNPIVRDQIEMPSEEHFQNMLANGNTLYYAYKIPYTFDEDAKTYSRHYVKKINLSDPSQPDIGDSINIPGALLKADDNSLYTHDLFWKKGGVESSLNRLVVKNGDARLQARHAFPGQKVVHMLLDDNGHALVNHSTTDFDKSFYLSLIDATQEDLPTMSMMEMDAYASLLDVQANRALCSVPDGLLIVNIENTTELFTQAFFPVRSRTSEFVLHDISLIFAAQTYGIYQIKMDVNNMDQ